MALIGHPIAQFDVDRLYGIVRGQVRVILANENYQVFLHRGSLQPYPCTEIHCYPSLMAPVRSCFRGYVSEFALHLLLIAVQASADTEPQEGWCGPAGLWGSQSLRARVVTRVARPGAPARRPIRSGPSGARPICC